MKMKTKIKIRKHALILILMVFIVCNAFSQGNTWKLSGNNNVGNNDFIGSTNKSDFVIKTNSQERIRIGTNSYTIIQDSVRIKGPLYIGDSSLLLGGAFAPGGSDLIQSTSGRIGLGHTGFSHFSNIKVGIGIINPQHKLHLCDNQPLYAPPPLPPVEPNPVYMALTNQAQAGGTGILSTDGFLVGIAANGNAQLIQQENLHMLFYTNNQEHVRIDSNGFVGINPYPNYPNRRLDVFDKDFPQLRLTRNDTVTFTDFETTSNGKLLINPTDTMVGINLSIIDQPTQAIDVNGGARIRQLPVADTIMNVVVADNDGVLHVDTAFAGGGAGDNDWFKAGTVSPNANIDDNIYTQGFTGLGDFSTIIPQSLLHLYQPDTALYAQFTNDNTNNTVTDGFLIGINEDGVAQLNQQENLPMQFLVNGSTTSTPNTRERMRITAGPQTINEELENIIALK